jgi:hypothetical protein
VFVGSPCLGGVRLAFVALSVGLTLDLPAAPGPKGGLEHRAVEGVVRKAVLPILSAVGMGGKLPQWEPPSIFPGAPHTAILRYNHMCVTSDAGL